MRFLLHGLILLPLLFGCSTTAEKPTSGQDAAAPTSGADSPSVLTDQSASAVSKKVADEASDPVVTISSLASEMGLSSAQLEGQAKLLSFTLNSRSFVALPCAEDRKDTPEKLCAMADVINNQQQDQSSPEEPKVSRAKKKKRYRFKESDISELQSLEYSQLFNQLYETPAKKILLASSRARELEACPRTFSAVAARKLEELLPDQMVQLEIDKLYEHADECFQPDEDGYEVFHLRMALLRRLWNNEEGARYSIQKAVRATKQLEPSRVLYWAGQLEMDPVKRAEHWGALVQKFPLTFHALKVWESQGVDPVALYRARPLPQKTRFVDGYLELNLTVQWIEALYLTGEKSAALRLSDIFESRFSEEAPNSIHNYLASLKSKYGTPHGTITTLSKQIFRDPASMNIETLQMLFPTPYWEILVNQRITLDPYLLLAIARQESSFNPQARSRANARGLLQLLPSTARHLSGRRKNDLYDPGVNISLADKFLNNLIQRFGSVELALAGYNAGPLRVVEWKRRYETVEDLLFNDLIPFRETRNYVSSILRNNYWYERLYRSEQASSSTGGDRSPASAHLRSETVVRLLEAHKNGWKQNANELGPGGSRKLDSPETAVFQRAMERQ